MDEESKLLMNMRHDINMRKKQLNALMKRYFKDEINGSFLIKMKESFLAKYSGQINQYYPPIIVDQLATQIEDMHFDICRHIVGVHRSNMVFLSKEEQRKKEDSAEYQEALLGRVLNNVRLRNYGSAFFRKIRINSGDDFLFFNLPYDLFLITIKTSNILATQINKGKLNDHYSFYHPLCERALSILLLFEDNFLGALYPLARVLIELFVECSILIGHPKAMEMHKKFASFDVEKTCCKQVYCDEFNKLYANRKHKSCTNKVDYLHYGWVDWIDGYDKHDFKQKPYSINGIIEFIKSDSPIENTEETFETLQFYYTMCHGYAHANVYESRYPLLHYFELSIILYFTMVPIYLELCAETNNDTDIEGIDIINQIAQDFSDLMSKYSIRTTELFEEYYS